MTLKPLYADLIADLLTPVITEQHGPWYVDLLAAIKALPETPHGIGAYFHRLGVRGLPGNSADCPFANYLGLLPYTKAEVGIGQIRAWPTGDAQITLADALELKSGPKPGMLIIPLTRAQEHFVAGFDGGLYPLLYRQDYKKPTPVTYSIPAYVPTFLKTQDLVLSVETC